MVQLVTRIDDELAAAIDELVEEGAFRSRSAVVRVGLQALLEEHRRQRESAVIVAAYRRTPQTAAEVGWADESTRRMIAEQPW